MKHPAERYGNLLTRLHSLLGAVRGTSAWLANDAKGVLQTFTDDGVLLPALVVSPPPSDRRPRVALLLLEHLDNKTTGKMQTSVDETKDFITRQGHSVELKRAKTVKDTLDVSEKLNGVRGEIEQQQVEFQALSKQVETVATSPAPNESFAGRLSLTPIQLRPIRIMLTESPPSWSASAIRREETCGCSCLNRCEFVNFAS